MRIFARIRQKKEQNLKTFEIRSLVENRGGFRYP
jgi:hypothetical protein